ncbi:uncharacterized protein TRIADDRAFT_52091 [Trichoplax adhaerens]|uniref:TIR domain-containing protein n=1 Tax=Trichoplax adhaerens TaxID=10228 RepID=B3RLR2_TRIAD|nr:predicted protein [Trichoplax adhaerens]EDV28828.1 predicted protein [Trichoplax adhaerens]|eukprot:XP_002108030.1 predicted protein [Trichoplax adhaerens]
MEVLDTKDEYYVDIFCSVEGAPHSHVQFLWFSEHGIIATDSEGECSYSNGLNITRRLRISRKRAERLKMIYCNVTNSLIKNRSCLYEAYISPIPDYTWSFIVSIILGSAILSVISVSIYLKATENRNLISMLETYIYIKKTNVLLIQSQPFITEDMEKFCQAITTKHNVNVLRAIPTQWIDMKTIRESLTRFKVIICVISEATKSNTVQKRFQFKDWVCNIIKGCLEISNDDIPPLFIIMNDKLNQDEYEDDINTLEYITCNDKLTEEQRERLEESFSRFYDKDWTI